MVERDLRGRTNSFGKTRCTATETEKSTDLPIDFSSRDMVIWRLSIRAKSFADSHEILKCGEAIKGPFDQEDA